MESILFENFKIKSADFKKLNGYASDNFLITEGDKKFVFKVYDFTLELKDSIQAESEYLSFLGEKLPGMFPVPVKSVNDHFFEVINSKIYRVNTFVEGELFADKVHDEELLNSLGTCLAEMNKVSLDFKNALIAGKIDRWDLQHNLLNLELVPFIDNPSDRKYVEYFFLQFQQVVYPQLIHLRKCVLQGDANEMNILVRANKVSGLIDFGDICYSPLINELAIACAYVAMDKEDPLVSIEAVISSYHKILPLEEKELDLLYYLIAGRLIQSLTNSAKGMKDFPENADYIGITAESAWRLIKKWVAINPLKAKNCFYKACSFETESYSNLDAQNDLNLRAKHLSKALSLNPIKMIGSAFQYMYDAKGNTYIDMRNNIPHVGHCHPRVVKAGQDQMLQLNTNTRYLYDSIHEYSELLLSKFPSNLNKVFFVNSGSAASDLAFRLAKVHTGKEKVMALEQGYHGNTYRAIEVSHYKYNSVGGFDQKSDVLKSSMPWDYKFQYGEKASEVLIQRAEEVINSNSNEIGAFIAEPIIGCGGQLDLPDGYLPSVYEKIRIQGGVCISDEVQTGFARLGSSWWGFEKYGVAPDIVVTGKCIGNGHPMAAVITTQEIADSFNNGMEFFSSFGGNPVSCEIGKKVIEVIDEERLMKNASVVGDYFKNCLELLHNDFDVIGDIRGEGFFIGVELINNKKDNHPNEIICKQLKTYLANHFVLLGSDGPCNNVLKIKPPMCFTKEDVDQVIALFTNFLELEKKTI